MDLFVVPTIGFELLYGFVIVRIDRRDLVWINVTTNPTAEWIARQIPEAFPWDSAPGYMIRDRDRRPHATKVIPVHLFHSELSVLHRIVRILGRRVPLDGSKGALPSRPSPSPPQARKPSNNQQSSRE